LAHLDPTFGIHIQAVLLGVGGARQDHVCLVRAGVAMGSQIDRKGGGLRKIDFVGAQQEENVQGALGDHFRG